MFSHHLAEIIVVAIKTVVSDRLEFVGTARKWFTIQDLFNILDRRIGTGKIGGKAAGIELAKIMMQGDNQLASKISTPQSYFVATDVFDQFKDANKLTWVMNQKYRSADEIRELYPTIKDSFNDGSFPTDITQELQELLQRHNGQPIIVRSSTLNCNFSGLKPSTAAYVAKNEYEFQSWINFFLTSFPRSYPNNKFVSGFCEA